MIAAMNELLLGPEQTLVHFFNALANQLQREITTSDLSGHLLKSTIALFVVLNPIGTVPLFIAITQNMKKEERKTVSKTPSSVRNSWHRDSQAFWNHNIQLYDCWRSASIHCSH